MVNETELLYFPKDKAENEMKWVTSSQYLSKVITVIL